ncbi:uncharacterized protein LOC116181907 [Photinus pyralis]|uniref:uncharacterized protein LOC116181907 n=1 Tax=Photinus pyralis TaxID=7054 RepID=UPI00126730D5|nr:uncharacterized protein LOC116181907 [Photinus pyralis]
MKLASNFNEEQPQNCQKQEMIPPTSPSKICSLESNPLETKNVIWQGTKENVSSRCLDVVGCNIVTSGSREIENGDTYASTSIKTRGDHLPEKASNSVSCPSCELQIPPNSGQLCVLCGMTIHQSETCFVAWDNRIVCTPCGSLDANEKTKRAESRSIENWRGLADIPVKRKRSSYLEPNSEFLCMNWSDMRKALISSERQFGWVYVQNNDHGDLRNHKRYDDDDGRIREKLRN